MSGLCAQIGHHWGVWTRGAAMIRTCARCKAYQRFDFTEKRLREREEA